MAKITMDGHEITKLVLKPATGVSVTKNLVATNSFGSSDEGKVVSNGALKAQSSQSISANGTYDTTDKNSVVVNVRGSESGGAQVVASGTFTGDGTYVADIPLGMKMAQTDFILNVWLANGTQVSPSSTTVRALVFVQIMVQKYFEAFDLSTNGDKTPSPQMVYPTVNDAETFVNRSPRGVMSLCSYVRQTTLGSEQMPVPHIIRRDTGFTFHVTKDSTEYIFMNGLTYNWEVVYVGNDPTNDIVEID